jgi:sugar lactone lactonase YvrE
MVSVDHPTEMYVAPDSVTVIPVQYDVARAAAMVEAFPGKPLYSSDEYDKRTVRLKVSFEGYLSDLTYFTEMGEFNSAVDANENLYVSDGQVYIFSKEGKRIGEIEVPERPVTICFGGKNNNILFITTNTSLYCYDMAK